MLSKRSADDAIAEYEAGTSYEGQVYDDFQLLIEYIRVLENEVSDLKNQLIEVNDALDCAVPDGRDQI